ncbi:MAG: 2-amino-4-hydroxy-6-hydroxymethyldihydropteridine diphosphokinase [Anaerolineales bacterium]
MDERTHQLYLSLGSNIEAEQNLPRAVRLLRENTQVVAVSHAWQSHAVGSHGPDFLNACVLAITSLSRQEFKEQVIRPIEVALGRVRTQDKFAPRPIDIDILFYDEEPFEDFVHHAFVVVPLAEIAPELRHPLAYSQTMASLAERLRSQTWIVPRLDVKLE